MKLQKKNIEASRATVAKGNRNCICPVEVPVTFLSKRQRYTHWLFSPTKCAQYWSHVLCCFGSPPWRPMLATPFHQRGWIKTHDEYSADGADDCLLYRVVFGHFKRPLLRRCVSLLSLVYPWDFLTWIWNRSPFSLLALKWCNCCQQLLLCQVSDRNCLAVERYGIFHTKLPSQV